MLTGKFIADFSDFYAAVQKADVELKTLSAGAEGVGRSLNRMVDQFSGRKIIQDAQVMTRAIEEVGGVGKLTQAELERVAAKAQEATAKMRAMGVEVPANLQKIADAAKPVSGGFGDMLQKVAPLAGAFGISFSVGAIVGFAKSVLSAADALTVMSDRTGMTVEGLQLLQAAGDDAGNTIEEMGGAVNQLQNRLAEGDDSAIAALERLGLEFENIRHLSPDRYLILISDALRKIEDPAEQARIVVDLFGKQGLVILPTLKRGFDDLKDSVHGMSETTVRDLDDVGDALERWWRKAKNAAGEVVAGLARGAKDPNVTAFKVAAKELEDSFAGADKNANRLANTSGQLFAKGLTVAAPYGQQLKDIEKGLERSTEEANRAAKAADTKAKADEKAAEALRKHNQELRAYNNWIVMREFDLVEQQMKADAEATAKAAKETEQFNAILRAGGQPVTLFATNVQAMGEAITATAQVLEQKQGVFSGFGDFLKGNIADTIQRAFEGGGDVVKSLGSSIGSWFTRAEGPISKTATKAMEGVFGKSIGGALGAVIPGIGTLMGPALDAAMKGIGKLFGRDEESKVVNPLRDQFIAAAGGLHQLNMAAHDAGLTLDQLLRADKEAEFKAAVDELTAAFQFQDAAMATLSETASRYGFTLEELGPAFQRQELDKQAQQLYKDWEVLNAAGISTIAITDKMGESVSAYVNQAVAMGSEIPEAMRPMLQSMVDMGQLTDAQGNKIESLEESGISFSMTMSQGFKALIDSVGKLTDAISRGLGLAVQSTSQQIKNMPRTVGVDVIYRDPGYKTQHDVTVNYHAGQGAPLESYQKGSEGFRDFGSGTPVMLHGWEAVVPYDESTQGPMLAPAGGAGGPATVVQIDARGALFGGPGDDQRLADAVERALSAKHGLTNKRRAA
jgi:hypothetical protein